MSLFCPKPKGLAVPFSIISELRERGEEHFEDRPDIYASLVFASNSLKMRYILEERLDPKSHKETKRAIETLRKLRNED